MGVFPAVLGTIVGCALLVEPSFLFSHSPSTSNDYIGYAFTLGDTTFYSLYILFVATVHVDPSFLTFATASVTL